jgi:hypothetical protein
MEIFKYFEIKPVPGSFERKIMTDAEYFSPKYKDYISNSKLGLLNPIQGGSPSKFLQGFSSSNSTALALGSAVHEELLQPESFKIAEETKPSSKLGVAYDYFMEYRKQGRPIEESIVLACNRADYFVNTMTNFAGDGLPSIYKTAIKKCLTYHFARKRTHDENGKELIYLPNDLRDKALSCLDSLRSNRKVMRWINAPHSYFEDVILCELEVKIPKDFKNPEGEKFTTRLKLKMKADHYVMNENTGELVLNDLKTTGKPVENFMGYIDPEGEFHWGSFDKFCYYRQMAFYGWMLKSYAEEAYSRPFTLTANMLVVQTLKPFHSMVFNVKNEAIKRGWKEFKELICRVAYHETHGYDKLIENEIELEDDPFAL